MLINGTTSIPVSGSPDSFGGEIISLPPSFIQRGGRRGYMERITAILHADCYDHCRCFTGK